MTAAWGILASGVAAAILFLVVCRVLFGGVPDDTAVKHDSRTFEDDDYLDA
jgi:hypothetical protein